MKSRSHRHGRQPKQSIFMVLRGACLQILIGLLIGLDGF
jgi:hypothetical protein